MISIKVDTSGLKRAANKINKLANSIETAKNKTNEEIPVKAAPEIESASRFAVEDWYMAYNPNSYERTESLLNVYDVQPQIGAINVHLSSGELGGHRASNEYIYNLAFIQGWHGGAFQGFPPLWRTGFNFSEWGDPAPKTTSAYMLMQKYIHEKKDTIQELTWSTFRGYLKW
ncbi:MAG TPA: hypothetical protein DCW90_16155 [Lachnospiraceae bacterium]|nr:hypothetical protein [Lachnospiraceae bacterium]